MELVTINSEEQYKNVNKVIKKSGYPTDDFWTSGSDEGNEGNFYWASNGESFDFQIWHPIQPDNFNGENCVVLRHQDDVYKFNDFPCDSKIYFICSKDDDNEDNKLIPRSGGRC